VRGDRESVANAMNLIAPAKVNVFLTVGARRPDGLHEIESVMQAVSLSDTVTLEPASGFEVSVTPAGAAPEGESNLAMRVARAFASLHPNPGVRISIEKRIPVAAGLGGGSADAAATLFGLNKLWGARVSKKALEKIGAGLGADVPFCVRGGTAAARGAGENLSVLPCPTKVWWVVGISSASLSTADVYEEYDRLGGGRVEDPYDVADALARADVERLAGSIRNDLERAALSLAPQIRSGRDALGAAGALSVILAGSGPTWLGLARDEVHARAVADAAKGDFARVEVVHSVDHGPKIV
jgi:4-diphosphocytidyl-2-C-methyl-D-erythritol kinase